MVLYCRTLYKLADLAKYLVDLDPGCTATEKFIEIDATRENCIILLLYKMKVYPERTGPR